jgi:serine/threonine protein kinase
LRKPDHIEVPAPRFINPNTVSTPVEERSKTSRTVHTAVNDGFSSSSHLNVETHKDVEEIKSTPNAAINLHQLLLTHSPTLRFAFHDSSATNTCAPLPLYPSSTTTFSNGPQSFPLLMYYTLRANNTADHASDNHQSLHAEDERHLLPLFVDFLTHLLKTSPNERMTAEIALTHPFVREESMFTSPSSSSTSKSSKH